MNNFLTLCAGSSSRFFNIPKHWLTVNGEPLVCRQVRQFGEVKIIDRAVVGETQFTCETLLQTRPLWKGRTIVLLADVYFTDETAKDIRSNIDPVIFWTDTRDIFAMAFDESLNNTILESIQKVLNQIEVPNDGRLWEMYRQFVGLPNNAHLPPGDAKYLRFVRDRTQDFDEPIEYESFLKGSCKNKLFSP